MIACMRALLLACLGARLAEGKVQTGVVGIGGPGGEQGRWRYLSKFGFGFGVGEYEVRVRHSGGMRHHSQLLSLHIYLDEDWSHVESLPACERVREGLSRLSYDVEIRRDGEWSDWHDGTLEQRVRPHIWYFALSNCNNPMNNNETVDVEFEFRALQEDGSQFGVEAQYMLAVTCVAVLLLSVFLVDYAARCMAFKNTNLALHPVIWALTGALALQFLAQALHAAHLWRYGADGVGAPTLDSLSESMLLASQVVHATLLIVIAQGYTLLQSKEEDALVMKLIFTAVLLVHAALAWFGKVEDDASHKTHHNEGAVGWIFLAIRLALCGWFVYAAQGTQRVAGMRQASFLHRFRMAGVVYFLAYPVIFLIVQALAPYLRHPVMQVGVLSMQLGSDFWLAGLFLSRGAYFEVSTLSCSILPDPRSPARNPRRTKSAGGSSTSMSEFFCGDSSRELSPDCSPASSYTPGSCRLPVAGRTTPCPTSSTRVPSPDSHAGDTPAARRRLSWAANVADVRFVDSLGSSAI